MSGTVYLVGAGPGAPDLLTLRAARILARADVVLHDALVHADTLALAARAQKVAVGKRCGRHSTAQRFIDKRLVDAARKHPVVVRLKGGDPMLFGRAQEEIEALEAARIPYEIIPGVTAALAAAAAIRTSLTQRGRVRTFTFATPRVGDGEPESDWLDGLRHANAGAIYMGRGEAVRIATSLIGAGMPAATPVALVVDASLASEAAYHTTLAQLPATAMAVIDGASLLLVGPQFRARARNNTRNLRTGEAAQRA
ncbi:MAG TPA: uroporphyrinogen-III C-methyltransferase [Casimicrobiaceae bacterium]|nr:uroporphyrinogen-III C-methyltransferase [Casimicrobiaceae bacterium]